MNTNGQNATTPIGLSEKQMRFLQNAIRAVSPRQRETLMQKVAAHLSTSPSDDALAAAINPNEPFVR
jgi:predicted nuclease of restriction endonuclease-like RecB superfamily